MQVDKLGFLYDGQNVKILQVHCSNPININHKNLYLLPKF